MDKRTLPKQQNAIRRNAARQMKQDGKTYAEIAKVMNISRQRVQQLTAPSPKESGSIISRANGICEVCHQPSKRLGIHHSNYLLPEIFVVCLSCHRKLHSEGKKQKYLEEQQERRIAKIARREKKIMERKLKDKEFITIKVRKIDAEELKRRYYYLRNDALRLAVLLGHYEEISIDDLESQSTVATTEGEQLPS